MQIKLIVDSPWLNLNNNGSTSIIGQQVLKLIFPPVLGVYSWEDRKF